MSMSDLESNPERDMVFDPDQDPEEKRALRQDYRSLTKKIEEHQGNPSSVTTDELLAQVQAANRLFRKVKGPQEATLDSNLLVKASVIGAQKAREMKSGSGVFDVDDFVTKLVQYMGGQRVTTGDSLLDNDSEVEEVDDVGPPLDWERIGRRAMAISRRAPVPSFMLGPLSIEQKKRRKGTRAKLEKNEKDLKKPQEIKEEDIMRSENETATNVANIEKLLDKETIDVKVSNINLFKFFINPNDFGQSVENLFYLSFLIREGKVAFEIVEGEPVIYPTVPFDPEHFVNSDEFKGLQNNQVVFEFDMATWKRAIEVFDITESIIPQRPKVELGNLWSG